MSAVVETRNRSSRSGAACVGTARTTWTGKLRRRWPVLAALALAWPIGVAAAAPGINSADLLILGVGFVFVWGWWR